jgi:trimeric autotransporter adhesin
VWIVSTSAAHASQQSGQVLFKRVSVPGVSVTATQGSTKVLVVTDSDGRYLFPDLADGQWKVDVVMPGFDQMERQITVAPGQPGVLWDLKMLPVDRVLAVTESVKSESVLTAKASSHPAPAPKAGAAAPEPPDAPGPSPSQDTGQANEALLVNGSVNNAATSPISLAQAFGNQRRTAHNLYNGGFGVVLDNSALDARPYSLTGIQLPKPSYNNLTLIGTLGGPIRIPYLMPHGPNALAVYERTRNSNSTALTGIVPTMSQRNGTADNVTDISPAAESLLAFYPLPDVTSSASYNYQAPALNDLHRDSGELDLDKTIGRREELHGGFAFQNDRASNTSLFGFADTTDTLGLNTRINWQHRVSSSLLFNLGYGFSRLRTRVSPYFANRINVSGEAGITGNSQAATDWGPPTLVFSSGIASLTDAVSAFNRNQTNAVSGALSWYRGRHSFTFGSDFRRQDYNYLSQSNPRGTFTFTSLAGGSSDFAHFLSGTPDASAIAYGNADKYLRESVYDLYVTDDWRLLPEFTLNVGLRWEYGAPITELKNRLVNLDVAPDFTSAQPVLASDPEGPVTNQKYPNSLIRPDRHLIEPRVAIAWKPIAGSSFIVRAGYGIYADTSVYQGSALQLAQQAPLSKSLSIQRSANCAISLNNGFTPCSGITEDTFAMNPDFQVGFAQIWQVALQRDLPAAIQMTVAYVGTKGSNGVQEFLPNTYAPGAGNPCVDCPVGFVFRTSGGSSTRQAGTVELRRRLRSGFSAMLLYTFSKSVDDDAILGGQGPVSPGAAAQTTLTPIIAQNWLDPSAERSRSTFDQRHLLNLTAQYTTGMGIGGGTLLGGWRGRALKEWIVVGTLAAASGLPETPVYLSAVNGTGFTNVLRPDRASQPLYEGAAGHFVNADAFTTPQPGQWGNAGRNSIEGPATLTFNASLARTFRLESRFHFDVRADATNILNHTVFSSYNTILAPPTASDPSFALSSPLFGVPSAANAMRSLQITARLRF